MPERWDQISQLFDSALALKPEERSAYLDAKCGADESLRREVELLLESHKRADEQAFIDSPAAERAAPLLAETDDEPVSDRLEAGQTVSHYVINKKLGVGGMGEVYLAHDTTLERTVAIKILPADVLSDKKRMQRFKQEAKIVSALNQPNIITIFEFGEAGPLHFIVTEYIDGETLRQHLRLSKLSLSEILDISIQVVSALDAAHEAKVVHRDIKPENIMIRRRDHLVKVLDFGLAKLTEKKTVRSLTWGKDTEARTETFLKTAPGSIMGTIEYMSPEQAQGVTVDSRTDLWSTGVVIYEMVAGRAPFKGVTNSHTLVDILERHPLALAQAAQVPVPPELERIIGKALAKNPDERYQTAKDMLIDLRNLRKRLEIDVELERSAPPTTAGTTTENVPARTTSPSSLPGTHSLFNPWKLALGILLATMAVVAVVVAVNTWKSSNSTPAVSTPASVSERTLNYWIEVQKYRDGKPYEEPFRLAREIVFEKDYQIRLTVSSPAEGYFYLLNEGPKMSSDEEQYIILFPSPTANEGSARLSRNQEIKIPEQSWFQFDDEAGTERLWVVSSSDPVAQLEAVKQFANPEDKGRIADPVLSKAVKAFLDLHSATKPNVEKDEELRLTTIKSSGEVLVHRLNLDHY